MDTWSAFRRNTATQILIALFVLCAIATAYIVATGQRDTLLNNAYGLLLGAIPLIGGLYGLATLVPRWGGWRSALGKSVAFLSLGLLSWSAGTYIFSGYYNLMAGVEVPYPSLSDVAYILSWPLWGLGMFYLSKATGAQFSLKNTGGKIIFLLIPVIVMAVSFYLLINVARGGYIADDSDMLKAFFDLFYPIGDVVILTAAMLIFVLSYEYFGGIFKTAIYFVLFGFLLNYIADFSFSYATTLELFYSGSIFDLLFATAMLSLSLGVSTLDPGRASS